MNPSQPDPMSEEAIRNCLATPGRIPWGLRETWIQLANTALRAISLEKELGEVRGCNLAQRANLQVAFDGWHQQVDRSTELERENRELREQATETAAALARHDQLQEARHQELVGALDRLKAKLAALAKPRAAGGEP